MDLWKKQSAATPKFKYKIWTHTLAKYNVVLHLQGKVPPNDLKLIPPVPESGEVQIAIPKEDQALNFTIDHRAFTYAIKSKLKLCQDLEIIKIKKQLPAFRWSQEGLQVRISCINMLVDFSQKMLIGSLEVCVVKQ